MLEGLRRTERHLNLMSKFRLFLFLAGLIAFAVPGWAQSPGAPQGPGRAAAPVQTIPGAAFRAACGYDIDKKLKSLKTPLTVLAPHDDIIEQTLRVKPLLKGSATLVDLPDLGLDLFHAATDRMIALVNRHLPAS